MIAKKLTSIRDTLDLDIQLLAMEMDYSAKDLRYISNEMITDGVLLEKFNKMTQEIADEVIAQEACTLDDNTIMYEFENESVVINRQLARVILIFDNLLTTTIEHRLNNYY